MRLHIIRHADPDYGRDDLTAMGKAQARALAQYTESLPLVRIISSPKGRAQATARPTAEQSGLPIEVMPWLRELDQLRTDYDSDNLHNPVVIWDLPGHVLKAVENEGETSSRFPQPLTAERFDELRQGWNTLLGELGVQLAQPIADVTSSLLTIPFAIAFFRGIPRQDIHVAADEIA